MQCLFIETTIFEKQHRQLFQ